jgi:SPP1 family predicted phage head-tail adaptor
MNPGELRNRITILDPCGEEENELGEIVPSLVEVATVWAKVIPIRGKEYLEMQKLRPELNYRVTIRYRKDIHPAMIIRFEDKELEIESVIDIASRKTYLELNCVEKRVKTNG